MARDLRQFATTGIVLSRTDYGEADRILTFITPDHGKVRGIAKGVRKSKAKLAGALELFSISDITIVKSRGEIDTLISARLIKHYANIVKDIDRTTAAYEFLRIINKNTEDKADESYFNLIAKSLEALDDKGIPFGLIDLWFKMQLLKISGHAPNLYTGENNQKLPRSKSYVFDYDKMKFASSSKGDFDSNSVKFLRVGLAAETPRVLARVEDAEELLLPARHLIQPLLQLHLRI